jgi:hypothetical protein
MALDLKGEELRVAFAKMRALLAEGYDHNQIGEELGLSWHDVDELRRKLLDEEATLVRKRPTEHTYVEFCMEIRRCMGDLDRVIDAFNKDKNVSAYVGAVRAKADLLERMIKVGQDFGLIERLSEAKGFAAGEAIKQMSNPQFRQFIVQEVHVFNQLLVKFGDKPIAEMDPGPLYRSLSTTKHPVPKEKVQGHARGKVHAGRRVVRK